MRRKDFKRIKLLISVFVLVVMIVAVFSYNIFLAVVGVLSGMLAVRILRIKSKQEIVDERVEKIGDKAARASFLIFTSILAVVSVLLVVVKKEHVYLQALGVLFSYMTSFMLVLYVLSYRYFEKEFGEDDEE